MNDIVLDSVPPTRETLSDAYGFQVPEELATVVRVAYEGCNGDGEEFIGFFQGICGFFFGSELLNAAALKPPSYGVDDRYQQTPAELFPMGATRCDGVHYGYVVHAPELESEDYPMGELCPMDSDGVLLLGSNTTEAFENMVSLTLSYWEDWEGSELALDPKEMAKCGERISLLVDALGIDPNTSKAYRCFGPDGNGLPVTPKIPEGWAHLPTSDGVGVLAPRDAFRPGPLKELDPYGPIELFVDEARQAMKAGFPATALRYLREAYWHSWPKDGAIAILSQEIIAVYEELGRPSLASVTRRNAPRWESTHQQVHLPHWLLES